MLQFKMSIGVCFALMVLASALRGAESSGVLKDDGLSPSATAYVLDDETDVLKQMPALHQLKKKFDADAHIRKGYESKIKTSQAFVTKSIKEHEDLKDKLSVVTTVDAHNRIVLRMNRLLIQIKESEAGRKEAEDSLAAMGSELPTKYVDTVLALDEKSEAATKRYAEFAADKEVKAAIDKANHGADKPLKLGPTPDFVAAATELAKYRSEINAEAITLTEDHGVQTVDVLVNGEPVKMVLDNGATMVSLPGETAAKLDLAPTPKDPVIQMKLADGHVIQAQVITLKSVRVGRFTVENVSCAVMAKGLNGADALLGNSFLSHFIVKLDQKAGQLQLTEVDTPDKKPEIEKKNTLGKGSAEPSEK